MCAVRKVIKIILVFVCILGLFFAANRFVRKLYPALHCDAVSRCAEEYELPTELIYAMMKTESNFNTQAKSYKDALGLMQIMEPTGMWIAEKMGLERFSKETLLEPETNIKMGCFYLSYLLDKYDGNKKSALAAYNAGFANVDAWLSHPRYSKNGKDLDVIPFPETEKYVNLVLKNERIYHYLYQ